KKELDAQETKLVIQETDINQDEMLNSVTETSNLFRDVQFPDYYNKLKMIWQTREPDASYYVIDLSDKEILYKIISFSNDEEDKDSDIKIDDKMVLKIEIDIKNL
ncbi:45286_t:CDS:2, partial [Gigaspora margarita]